LIGKVHLTFAALLFLTLAFFSLFLFTKSKKGESPTPEKLIRNKIYIICGITIILCIISIAIYKLFIQTANPISAFVFWAETIALIAFGTSWLTKGETLFPDE
jgi:amino acid transporter